MPGLIGPFVPLPEARTSNSCDQIVWQLIDSAFPTGAFAHSGGLEAARHGKLIETSDDLCDFLRHSLVQNGRSTLPFISESYHDLDRFEVLDTEYDAFLTNHVANRASRSQGRAYLTAAEIAFRSRLGRSASGSLNDHEETRRSWWLTKLRDGVVHRTTAAHLPVVFGAVTRLLVIPLATALRIFLYTTQRDLISSAVRLNIVGSLTAQAMQFELIKFTERVATHCETLRSRDAAMTASLIDLMHATHDRLYTRLFQS
jgi:urease accessory protein